MFKLSNKYPSPDTLPLKSWEENSKVFVDFKQNWNGVHHNKKYSIWWLLIENVIRGWNVQIGNQKTVQKLSCHLGLLNTKGPQLTCDKN